MSPDSSFWSDNCYGQLTLKKHEKMKKRWRLHALTLCLYQLGTSPCFLPTKSNSRAQLAAVHFHAASFTYTFVQANLSCLILRTSFFVMFVFECCSQCYHASGNGFQLQHGSRFHCWAWMIRAIQASGHMSHGQYSLYGWWSSHPQ